MTTECHVDAHTFESYQMCACALRPLQCPVNIKLVTPGLQCRLHPHDLFWNLSNGPHRNSCKCLSCGPGAHACPKKKRSGGCLLGKSLVKLTDRKYFWMCLTVDNNTSLELKSRLKKCHIADKTDMFSRSLQTLHPRHMCFRFFSLSCL